MFPDDIRVDNLIDSLVGTVFPWVSNPGDDTSNVDIIDDGDGDRDRDDDDADEHRHDLGDRAMRCKHSLVLVSTPSHAFSDTPVPSAGLVKPDADAHRVLANDHPDSSSYIAHLALSLMTHRSLQSCQRRMFARCIRTGTTYILEWSETLTESESGHIDSSRRGAPERVEERSEVESTRERVGRDIARFMRSTGCLLGVQVWTPERRRLVDTVLVDNNRVQLSNDPANHDNIDVHVNGAGDGNGNGNGNGHANAGGKVDIVAHQDLHETLKRMMEQADSVAFVDMGPAQPVRMSVPTGGSTKPRPGFLREDRTTLGQPEHPHQLPLELERQADLNSGNNTPAVPHHRSFLPRLVTRTPTPKPVLALPPESHLWRDIDQNGRSRLVNVPLAVPRRGQTGVRADTVENARTANGSGAIHGKGTGTRRGSVGGSENRTISHPPSASGVITLTTRYKLDRVPRGFTWQEGMSMDILRLVSASLSVDP